MDVVLGSGNKGKSFLTWDNNSLFQLQGSFVENPGKWINSPGYLSLRCSATIVPSIKKCSFP